MPSRVRNKSPKKKIKKLARVKKAVRKKVAKRTRINFGFIFKKLSIKLKKRTIQRIKDAGLIFLFFLGLHLIAAGFFYQKYRQTVLSFRVAPSFQLVSQQREAEPVEMKIESIGINLSIVPAQIVEGMWQTSDTDLTHLATSARPGERGNTVIYGHNRWGILAGLKNIKIGDQIIVKSEDDSIRNYSVEEILVVSPDQIEVVLPTEEEVLTLYTCTGFLDSKRLIVKAHPLHRQFDNQE